MSGAFLGFIDLSYSPTFLSFERTYTPIILYLHAERELSKMALLNATGSSSGTDVEAKNSFDNDRELLARLGKKQVFKVRLSWFGR